MFVRRVFRLPVRGGRDEPPNEDTEAAGGCDQRQDGNRDDEIFYRQPGTDHLSHLTLQTFRIDDASFGDRIQNIQRMPNNA